MTNSVSSVPKVELHVHLEGAIPVETIVRLAKRNSISLPANLIVDGEYQWSGFPEFLQCYDAACTALVTETDFIEATYDYLKECANQNVIYCEIIISPTHADRLKIGYKGYLQSIDEGCKQAEKDFGIITRLIVTIVRHESHDEAKNVVAYIEKAPHARVTGFQIAGDENHANIEDYRYYFDAAKAAGLGLSAHAGEIKGPDEVRKAIEILGVSRIGHGISAIEDKDLIKMIVDKNICLEVCPTSNIKIAARCDSYAKHPLRKLYNAKVPITINSDDPPFFSTTIGKEYQVAMNYFAFTINDLVQVSNTGIEHAFLDKSTKTKLYDKIKNFLNSQSK